MSTFNLNALFEPSDASSAVHRRQSGANDLDRARLALAVRGWVEPLKVLDAVVGVDDSKRLLGVLAGEAETAVEARPGQWYLSLPARSDALAGRNEAELRTALLPVSLEDHDDPIHRAMNYAVSGKMPELGTIDASVLTALGQVGQWLGDRWNLPVGTAQVENEIAARTLDSDLARMTSVPLVGAVHRQALATLTTFATQPTAAPIHAIYIHGGGGAGKTTLLAYLQRQLMARFPPTAVARIDFDEPAIDPARMVTLNLALVEQLARSVTAIGGRISAMLPMLRRTALVQRDARSSTRPSARRPIMKGARADPTLHSESIVSESASDEGSILFGLLDRQTVGGPVVIILDTAELVIAHSDRIASSLAAWIRFLQLEARATDLRLVIAGRDPPPDQDGQGLAADHLLSRLQRQDVVFEPAISLPELSPEESAALLRHSGVTDELVIASAIHAVPGNPLLLRITADALNQGDDDLRQSVCESHRHSRIDPASARNYLMRRIVAHVGDPAARPYVLAAMYSPFLSPALLEEVIIPAAARNPLGGDPPRSAGHTPTGPGRRERQAQARRVFQALASTYWLTRPSLDSGIVPFNRDVRAFALKLLASAEGGAVLERDIRQSAEIFHLRRSSRFDKAMATYHAALLGHSFRLPRDREGTLSLLRDVLDELPPDLRDRLQAEQFLVPTYGKSDLSDHVASMSDADWRIYLEGDGSRDGEGMHLVNDDRAREALSLYLGRLTRPPGHPPTFVIKALSDVGDWVSKAVDIKGIISDESPGWLQGKNPAPDTLSRIYWLTRLALLMPSGRLSAAHVKVLRSISANTRPSGTTALPGLIAVAEARMGLEILSPAMRRSAEGSPEEGRLYLAAPGRLDRQRFALAAGHVAVAQRDWLRRLESYPEAVNVQQLNDLQRRLDGLHGQPMAEVNQLFDGEREPVEILWDGKDMAPAILLMRGQTYEFLRPLREALLVHCADGIAGPRTRSLFLPILERMSIRPAELEPDTFFERLENNPGTWCTAFVSYADRSRLLPSLCEQLMKLGNHGRNAMPHRVASAFLEWDKALCGGGTSDWSQFELNAVQA